MSTPYEKAVLVRNMYLYGCEFPEWVLTRWNEHAFDKTITFYHKEDSLESVRKIMLEREPCNIGMRRIYDGDALEAHFGYKYGAYTAESPNVAVYCHADIQTPEKTYKKVHVLNVIGCALDSPRQPDVQYYTTKEKVLDFYKHMWSLVLESTKSLGLSRICLYNIGGGAFAGPYGRDFQTEIFEPSFTPLVPKFVDAGIEILGYDFVNRRFTGGRIPDSLFEPTVDLKHTLFLNAWDPWSLIGNGNEFDNSLDGYWGRSSNMSVLGWLHTNPSMKFVAV